MRTVTFKELRLINCGCFDDKSIEFNPRQAMIVGANGTGKTTIADAVCWLLTDKLMNGNTADMRPHDTQGKPLNQNDVIVTLWLTVDDREYILEKSVRKSEGGGNETVYSVNGMQKRPRDYKAAIEDIFGATQETIGYCTSAAHFLKLDTTHRKAFLYDLVTVDDDEKLAADDERFVSLCPRLQVASLDDCLKDCRKTLKGQGKDKGLERTLDEVFARFDEVSRAIAEMPESEYLKGRLTEIAEQSKAVKSQIVATEQAQDLLRQFAQHKTQVYEDAINGLFEVAKFAFHEPTVSGDSSKDICDLTFRGEKYGKRLNSGAKVLLNTDLIIEFQKVNRLNLPVFVDNAETCSLSTVAQIRDICSEHQIIVLAVDDCELTVEF